MRGSLLLVRPLDTLVQGGFRGCVQHLGDVGPHSFPHAPLFDQLPAFLHRAAAHRQYPPREVSPYLLRRLVDDPELFGLLLDLQAADDDNRHVVVIQVGLPEVIDSMAKALDPVLPVNHPEHSVVRDVQLAGAYARDIRNPLADVQQHCGRNQRHVLYLEIAGK